MVDIFFFFPFQVLSVPFTKPTDKERDRGRESASACERLFGALGICAHHNTVSKHLVSVPTITLSRGGGKTEFIGPCSLLMVALDASTSDTHTHTHTPRTHAQITSAAVAGAMHKDTGLAHRPTDVALALHAIG
jgi:hypothetical protein